MKHRRPEPLLAASICAFVVMLCLIEPAFCSGAESGRETPECWRYEGELVLNREIPVGIVAGTGEHPRLVEIESVRIEPKELPRGVTARVGWSAAAAASWQIAVDLLDSQGRVLRNPRDKATLFRHTGSGRPEAQMHYGELDLGWMSFQGRRHASKVRVTLESVDDRAADAASGGPAVHPLSFKVIDGATRRPVAAAVVVVSCRYLDQRRRSDVSLYATDAEGLCRIAGSALVSGSLSVRKDGYAPMQHDWSSRPTLDPLPGPPEAHVIELRPARAIGGIVQDQDGRPIAGVAVEVNAHSFEVGGIAYVNRTTETDSNGVWRLDGIPIEADNVSVSLKHPGYVSDSINGRHVNAKQLRQARAFKHTARMDRGVAMRGRVLDEQGQPVPRAAVVFAPPIRGGFYYYGHVYVLTDPAGGFRLDCAAMPRADGRMDAGPPALLVEAPGYAPAIRKITIEPDLRPVEIRLTPAGTMSVRVVDPNGHPIQGASTVLRPLPEDRHYRVWLEDSDEQGRFRIPNAPDAEMHLTIVRKGYLTLEDYAVRPSDRECVITMKPGPRLQGTVCDAETNEPIPYFTISLRDAGDGDILRFHDSDDFYNGRYEFTPTETVEMDLRLTVSAPGYQWAESGPFRLDGGARRMDFRLTRDPWFNWPAQTRTRTMHVVRGVVRDADGRPVPNVRIAICPHAGVDATTDADGRFKMSYRSDMWRPGPGPEVIHLIARDHRHDRAAAVKLALGTKGDLDIRLGPDMVFSGRIIDPQGKGIPNARLVPVLFWSPGFGQNLSGAAQSDPNGFFEARALPRGYCYRLRVTADGYGEQSVEADARKVAGNRLELKPLVLYPTNLDVSGIVVTAGGKPVGVANVSCSGWGQPHRSSFTDTKGRFTLKDVCAGPISIHAYVGGWDGLRGRVEAQGGANDVRVVIGPTDSGRQPATKGPL